MAWAFRYRIPHTCGLFGVLLAFFRTLPWCCCVVPSSEAESWVSDRPRLPSLSLSGISSCLVIVRMSIPFSARARSELRKDAVSLFPPLPSFLANSGSMRVVALFKPVFLRHQYFLAIARLSQSFPDV